LKGLLDRTDGSIVLGGQTDASQKYIAPTVVKDVGPNDSLMSEYVLNFAPPFRFTSVLII
jgi:acyl-CoA reductase-like NAD-dependent aldehyde dehydrogenase